MLNYVAVDAKGPGNLRAWAFSDPPAEAPLASVVNYSAVPGLNLANGIVTPVCQETVTSPCTNDFSVRADASGTHVVIDVAGYFAPSGVEPLSSSNSNDVPLPSGDCVFLGMGLPGGRYPLLVHFPPPAYPQTLRVDSTLDVSIPPLGAIEIFVDMLPGSVCFATPAARYANPQAVPGRFFVPVRKDVSYWVMRPRDGGADITYSLWGRYTGPGQAVVSAPSRMQGLHFR
jgi:hypothetical protein